MKISRRENRLKLLKLSRLEVKNIFLLKRQEVLGLSSLLNFFIGGFHNFIGDNLFLLAIFQFYWRKSNFIGGFHNFIGELEISRDFSQYSKNQFTQKEHPFVSGAPFQHYLSLFSNSAFFSSKPGLPSNANMFTLYASTPGWSNGFTPSR